MQRKLLFVFKVCLSVALFWGIERFCHKQTGGFQVVKILSSQQSGSPEGLPQLSAGEKASLKTILSQPFYFLGRGGQSYAFVSEDGETVLKFFKQHHIRFWRFLERLPVPSVLNPLRQHLLASKIHQSPAFFESCRIADAEFREQTGLIYLHLEKTDLFGQQVTLIDHLGIAHPIDLDTTDFALQKRAESTRGRLRKLMRENDLAAAKQCLKSLVAVIAERSQKGIFDRDPNVRRNMGFVGNQAIEIDLGSYTRQDPPANLKEDLREKTAKLQRWLDRKNPELGQYLSQQIDVILFPL